MDTLEIIIIAGVLLVIVLAVGGYIAVKRRLEATETQFRARVEQANHDLAQAHATDNGWEPGRVEAAARRAVAERSPGEAIKQIALVQVVDKPGTEQDEAVFHVETDRGSQTITLGRRGEEWVAR